MDSISLFSYLLVPNNREQIIDDIKKIQDKLTKVENLTEKITTEYEFIMSDWLVFSIHGITWEIGIQLQEVIEEFRLPTIFIGNEIGGLTDISQLKKGKFDSYLSNTITEPEIINDLIYTFKQNDNAIDYFLKVWKMSLLEQINVEYLDDLLFQIDFKPLKVIIKNRINDLTPEYGDETQEQLDEYF